MSLTPQKYTTATAIEALRTGAERLKNTNLGSLVKTYGARASIDKVLCDQYRLTLKTKILKSWKYRRHITTAVVFPLSCYEEVGPSEELGGKIEMGDLGCSVEHECCLGPLVRDRIDDLKKLQDAIKKQPTTAENTRRARALREIIRKPKALMSEKTCRNLGDAFFALFAPPRRGNPYHESQRPRSSS